MPKGPRGQKRPADTVEEGFGDHVDYAVLQKLYGMAPEAQKRYSPAKYIGIRSEDHRQTRSKARQHQLTSSVRI